MQQIHHTASGAGANIGASENHATNSRMHNGAGAHHAWLLRHVKVAIDQTPISDCRLGLRQSQHLGMRGRVLEKFHLVVTARDDSSRSNDDRANRNFLGRVSFLRQPQCVAHEGRIVFRVGFQSH